MRYNFFMKTFFHYVSVVISKLFLVLSIFFVVAVVYGLVKNAYFPEDFSINITGGVSMYPTFSENDTVTISPSRKPVIGDIVLFECRSDRCANSAHEGEEYSTLHRLTAIEQNGCMHIEGDNQPDAWDTRDYGCLMPDEVEFGGVTHKLFDK